MTFYKNFDSDEKIEPEDQAPAYIVTISGPAGYPGFELSFDAAERLDEVRRQNGWYAINLRNYVMEE